MQIGDKVIVVERIAIEQRGNRGKKIRKTAGTIIYLNGRYFALDNGKYRRCFLLADVRNKIVIVKKDGDISDPRVMVRTCDAQAGDRVRPCGSLQI